VLAKEKKNELTTTTVDAENFLKTVLKKKNNFITNVNKISLGQANNISIGDLSLLLDVKAFYDYNALNNGVLEFALKMLNSNIKQRLKDTYGSSKIDFIKAQILSHASYLKFLKNVKDGIEQPFFDIKGFPNSERTPSFDDLVKKYFTPKEYIPSAPKIEEPVAPAQPAAPAAPEESPPAPE
jgi:hypothetical protein